ncbi:MAG: hypothetical protein ACXABC_16860 [Candidatus Thorarchaeota archaeon]|jgi:uncharacterized protein (DUF58 family)
MRTETAQRILWFAIIFIILMIIVTVAAGVGFALLIAFIDIGTFISDPNILAFLADLGVPRSLPAGTRNTTIRLSRPRNHLSLSHIHVATRPDGTQNWVHHYRDPNATRGL